MMIKNKKQPKISTEVGVPEGGKKIATPRAGDNPKVVVKGTKTIKKQTATWY
tara:strand:- start:320 stop:475 length:156 start_codon:yes stop_codon:yes gene_type:complete